MLEFQHELPDATVAAGLTSLALICLNISKKADGSSAPCQKVNTLLLE